MIQEQLPLSHHRDIFILVCGDFILLKGWNVLGCLTMSLLLLELFLGSGHRDRSTQGETSNH